MLDPYPQIMYVDPRSRFDREFSLKFEGIGLYVTKPSVHTYPRTLFLPMSKAFKIEMKPVVNFD